MNLDLLRILCLTPGAPGSENLIREQVIKEVKPYVDSLETDPMGNLIAFKKGRSGLKVMVAAHLDEISFIVSHIDNDGFLHFLPLGGFDPKTLTAQRVIVHGREDLIGVMGSKPIHIMSPEERNKAPQLKDYFIDLGMPAAQVKEKVSIGDKVTRERDLTEIGDCVCTKSLDNRISVYILIEALKRMGQPAHDFYAVFTVQEEVGLRGATTATRKINPDFGIGLDVTIANDVPGASAQDKITALGAGTAIKILDGSVITDYRMVRFMEGVARRHEIPFQRELLPAGGTDTGALQRSGDGAIAGCISIPARHIHSVVEMCHKGDIEHSIQLLKACIEELDQFDYQW
ncbi:MAG: M42 family peptidase [Bacteroidetes bacterium]|nr:MAG: M42 family peptidase [Bacteroidota bacterium]